MTYAEYAYYAGTYMGNAISEEDFPRFSMRASAFLDYFTQGRAEKNAELDALKMACCALAERYQAIEAAEMLVTGSLLAVGSSGAEIQSESVGSYSVTRRSAGDSAQSAQSTAQTLRTSLSAIAAQYLAPTGLLYRGGGGRTCTHLTL